MNEYEQAHCIGRKVLDRINADPDDVLAVLSRALLRVREHHQAELDRVMEQAVRFAGYTREWLATTNESRADDVRMYADTCEFLASPEVRDWRARQKEGA